MLNSHKWPMVPILKYRADYRTLLFSQKVLSDSTIRVTQSSVHASLKKDEAEREHFDNTFNLVILKTNSKHSSN